MRLTGMFAAAAARCAPPGNKPLPDELRNCHAFLGREWAALPELRVVLCLGRLGHDAVLGVLQQQGVAMRKTAFRFAHGAEHSFPGAPLIVDSFHVSRQNTNTGRLTPAMFDAVLARVRAIATG